MSDPKPTSSAAAISTSSLPRADDHAWTTLASFGDVGEAEVTRGLMEQAQIPVRITNVHSPSLMGIPAMALGGIGVQVMQQDLARARATIRDARSGSGDVVFRVINHQLFSMALKFTAAAMLATFAGIELGLVPRTTAPTLVLLAMVAGALLGRVRTFFLCSDLQCSARLTSHMATCPGCGGEIAGDIGSLSERLEAADRVRAERKARLEAP